LVEEGKGYGPLGRTRYKWKNDVKMGIEEEGNEGVICIREDRF
jgi:hypothetical protein